MAIDGTGDPRRANALWRLAALRSFLGLALLVLHACKAPPVDPGASTSTTATASTTSSTVPAGPCSPAGSFRCQPDRPNELEVCDPLTANGWTFIEDCGTPSLCDAVEGQCLSCQPEELRCEGFQLEVCDSAGRGWGLLTTCQNEQYCDRAGGQCAECLPGMGYCGGEDNSTLFICNANRTAFTPMACARAGDCNTTSMTCRPCIPGEFQCNKTDLQQCNDASEWALVDTCTTESLCQKTRDALLADPLRTPSCEAPVCVPGERKCAEDDGRNLLACPPSQDEWALLNQCATPELCQQGLAGGACAEAACSPGTPRCAGLSLQVCNADGTAHETVRTCASANECNIVQMDCVLCTPGDVQCNGATRQACNDAREWVTEETCATSALCRTSSEVPATTWCEPSACPETPQRCNGAQLEACNADQTGWTPLETCASADLCNALDARCDAQGCPAAGEVRCLNNAVQQCPESLSDWVTLEQCAAGTACDPVSLGCTDTCPDPPFRCNSIQPEECVTTEEGIAWQVVGAPCATAALCQADATGASCTPPACGGSLPDYRCTGQVVERCNAQRTGWTAVLTCEAGQTCDAGTAGEGPGQCDVCAADTYNCTNASLMHCEPNGQSQGTMENCRDAEHCVADGTLEGSYCLRCDAEETQCNGTALDVCAEDRRGWVESEACDELAGCHDNPGSLDYCNVCEEPGERRCLDSSTLALCDAEQRSFGDDMNCQFGCQDDATADYCRDCAPNSAECSATASDERRVCSALGRWGEFAECPDGSDCYNSGTADYCGSCTPGSYSCTSATERQLCAANGTPGATSTCPMATPVCLGSSGACVACNPTAPAECTGAAGTADRRTCSPAGAWQSAACSGVTPVCLAGACVQCVPGTQQCTGTTAGGRRVCSAAGVWEDQSCTTAGANVCYQGTCSACNPMTATPRCTGSGAGREVCTAGAWTADNCAGANNVCVAGVCQACNPMTQPAECITAEAPSGRRVCSAGSWMDADCAAPTPVCSSGSCVCQTGSYRCSAGARERCSASAWVSDACAMGTHCTGQGVCSQCSGNGDCSSDFPTCTGGTCQCTLNMERCTAGGQHQVCSGTAWMNVPCTGSTPVCDAPSGSCVCMHGEQRCSAGVRQTCTNGAWGNDPGSPACAACTTGAQCSGTTPICNGSWCVGCSSNNCPMASVCAGNGACVECTTTNTSLCLPAEPACSASNECVECTAANDDLCVGAEPICGTNNQCRACMAGECGAGFVCAAGACVACTPSDATQCPPTLPACTAGNLCVQCTASNDAACTGTTPICNVATNTCAACTSNAECAPQTCAVSGACVD